MSLSSPLLTSLFVLAFVYFFLITEKINKVIITGLGAGALILLQIFATSEATSEEVAFHFISKNLDILGFIMGMMILIGIVKESGAFEAIAIWLVKIVKGNPQKLLAAIGALTLIMTIFLSNIPTILILTPVLLVLIRELKLPHFPFFFVMITLGNIGGATTPISDPTTYYQAKTVGLNFLEVVSNSGVIVLLLFAVTTIYTQIVFRKQLKKVEINESDIANFDPKSAIKDKKILFFGVPLLILAIIVMSTKELITNNFHVSLDNAVILLTASFIAMLLFKIDTKKVFQEIIDWEIIFFFMGLFIIIGALEHQGVIAAIGKGLISVTNGNLIGLLLLITLGSGILSMFIDNVPYNIAMVGAIMVMGQDGIFVYPLWWALNLGTSLGGAGSPIGAACNVVALGQADKEGFHSKFSNYLKYGFPLVVINAIITFGFLYAKYGSQIHP